MSRRTSTASATEARAQAAVPTTPPSADEPTVLIGRLTRDPELRHTASGKAVTTLRVAVNHADAEASFSDVVCWGRTAEVVCQYLKKGRLIEATGRLQERSWTGNDGNERSTTEVVAYRVEFVRSQRSAPASDQEIGQVDDTAKSGTAS